MDPSDGSLYAWVIASRYTDGKFRLLFSYYLLRCCYYVHSIIIIWFYATIVVNKDEYISGLQRSLFVSSAV